MQQKLLQKAGLLSLMIVAVGYFLNGCIDEPNPPVVEKLTSKIRFIHADYTLGAIDIWIDWQKVASNVDYKSFIDYRDVQSGNRWLKITDAATGDTLLTEKTSIRSLTQMTIFFYPGQTGTAYYIAQEKFTYANEETTISPDSSKVKVINLTNVPVTFVRDDWTGPTVIDEVAAGTLTPYRNFITGSFSMFVVSKGSQVASTPVTPSAKKRYTYFLMGGGTPYLLVLSDNSLATYP